MGTCFSPPVCLCAMSISYVCGVRKLPGPLESQTVVSCHAAAGNYLNPRPRPKQLVLLTTELAVQTPMLLLLTGIHTDFCGQ